MRRRKMSLDRVLGNTTYLLIPGPPQPQYYRVLLPWGGDRVIVQRSDKPGPIRSATGGMAWVVWVDELDPEIVTAAMAVVPEKLLAQMMAELIRRNRRR